MHGIEIKSGVNDCAYNIKGKCVNKAVTRSTTKMSRDWYSKMNCTVTQYGVIICSEYLQEAYSPIAPGRG
jgi:hypothetical protein